MYNKQHSVNTNSIGFRIRELRQKKGLTQTELARLIGCAQNTITEWEKRKGRAPGKKLLGKVAKILGVSIDYLLGVEKTDIVQVPCYGEVLSEEFIWEEGKEPDYCIEIPQSEYAPNRFSLKILDDLLEPTVYEGDYCIFEKLLPEDGDIAIVRFPEKQNKTIIRMWRQEGRSTMLSETKLHKICSPYFFEFTQEKKGNLQRTEKKHGVIIIEGRLVAVKKIPKSVTFLPRVNYVIY